MTAKLEQLLRAISNRGTAAVGAMLDARVDPNVPDKCNVTPLHRAIRARCSAAVRILLERGASPVQQWRWIVATRSGDEEHGSWRQRECRREA